MGFVIACSCSSAGNAPRSDGACIGSLPEVDNEGVIDVGEVAGRRMTVEIEGDVVVFLIGARFSKLQFVRSFAELASRVR